jgi:YggT family protein
VALRLIAEVANLNPFGWSSRTIRRLTDPLIGPLRRALVRFGVDPKYSPLIAIIITIVMGWVLLQLVTSVANTIAGVYLSLTTFSVIPFVGYILYGMFSLYILIMFLRVIFSWVTLSYSNRLMRFVVNATEPLLAPLRQRIPPMGGFDLSPMFAFFIVWLIQSAVGATLLRGWQIHFFG